MFALELGLASIGILLAVYALLVGALIVAGRRVAARALAGFVPDCAVLFARLVRDPAVSRWRKLILVPLAAYLALPFDMVPDFIPIAGQVDDAIVVALGLRVIVAGADPELVRRHWPGPQRSLDVVLRLGGLQGGAP